MRIKKNILNVHINKLLMKIYECVKFFEDKKIDKSIEDKKIDKSIDIEVNKKYNHK